MIYDKEDKKYFDEINSKGYATSDDKEKIWQLYTKYIATGAINKPCSSCGASGISKIWWELKDWMLANTDKF